MDDIAWSGFGLNVVASAGAVAFVMLVTCAIGVRMRRHSIVDIVWGMGFTAIAWLTVVLSADQPDTTRVRVIAVLTTLWGLRLAAWLAWRNRGMDDRRYVALMKRAKGNPTLYALRTVYLVQGAVMWIVSLPVQLSGYERGSLGWPAAVGVGLYAVGLGFEAVGDVQLARFTRDRANAGRVMDRGLWRYTRHPNYFGDVCVWWGIFLVALGHPAAVVGAMGPLVMTHFLLNVSGKALLERHLLRSRPGYEAYVATTSGFVPLPPRRVVRPGLIGQSRRMDDKRVASRSELLPEEKAVGSDDPVAQAHTILEESEARTLDQAPASSSTVEHRTSDEATPPAQ